MFEEKDHRQGAGIPVLKTIWDFFDLSILFSQTGIRKHSGVPTEAFIQNFKGTKDKIVKALNECISEYQTLIDQIVRVKQESDTDIARQLNS